MQAAERQLSRRGFLLAIAAAPAALAACAPPRVEPAVTEPGPADPAAVVPGVPDNPRPPAFVALRQVPLDREVPPFAFRPAAGVRAR